MSKTKSTLSAKKLKDACDEVCLILKALSHPQRLLILDHLLRGPKTVSQLVTFSCISQSQISQFLIRMKLEGLVQSVKVGKFQVYKIADSRLSHLMKTIHKEYCK